MDSEPALRGTIAREVGRRRGRRNRGGLRESPRAGVVVRQSAIDSEFALAVAATLVCLGLLRPYDRRTLQRILARMRE